MGETASDFIFKFKHAGVHMARNLFKQPFVVDLFNEGTL